MKFLFLLGNRYSYNSKSAIVLLDEAFDVSDQHNMHTTIPKVLDLLSEEYTSILVVSQRDTSHLSDHQINVSKSNGVLEIDFC